MTMKEHERERKQRSHWRRMPTPKRYKGTRNQRDMSPEGPAPRDMRKAWGTVLHWILVNEVPNEERMIAELKIPCITWESTSLKIRFPHFIFMHTDASVCMCTNCMQYLWWPEEGIRCLRLELQRLWASMLVLRLEPGSSPRAAGALNQWAISLVPGTTYLQDGTGKKLHRLCLPRG